MRLRHHTLPVSVDVPAIERVHFGPDRLLPLPDSTPLLVATKKLVTHLHRAACAAVRRSLAGSRAEALAGFESCVNHDEYWTAVDARVPTTPALSLRLKYGSEEKPTPTATALGWVGEGGKLEPVRGDLAREVREILAIYLLDEALPKIRDVCEAAAKVMREEEAEDEGAEAKS